jgi:hypothetical protein
MLLLYVILSSFVVTEFWKILCYPPLLPLNQRHQHHEKSVYMTQCSLQNKYFKLSLLSVQCPPQPCHGYMSQLLHLTACGVFYISCEPSSQGTFIISAHILSSCMYSLYFAMPKEQLRQSKTWWSGTVQIKIGTSSVTKMRHVPTRHLHLHDWHFFLPGITNITSNEHF